MTFGLGVGAGYIFFNRTRDLAGRIGAGIVDRLFDRIGQILHWLWQTLIVKPMVYVGELGDAAIIRLGLRQPQKLPPQDEASASSAPIENEYSTFVQPKLKTESTGGSTSSREAEEESYGSLARPSDPRPIGRRDPNLAAEAAVSSAAAPASNQQLAPITSGNNSPTPPSTDGSGSDGD